MKKFILLLLLTAASGAYDAPRAGSFGAQGQFVGTVSPVITALLAQFPAGGPGLRAAIALAIEGNP